MAYLQHLQVPVTPAQTEHDCLGVTTVKAGASQQGNDTSLPLEGSILGGKPNV